MKKLLCIFAIAGLLLTGCSVKPIEEVTDAEKFAQEYEISKKNPFQYITAEEAIKMLEEGTGILYFGFPECPWCQASIKIWADVFESKNIKQVYYYNPKEIREQNTEEYKKIIELTKDYLFEDADGNPRLFVPDMFFIKDGKIIGHNNDMSTMSGNPEEYLTKEKKEELRQEYLKLVVKLYSDNCSEC